MAVIATENAAIASMAGSFSPSGGSEGAIEPSKAAMAGTFWLSMASIEGSEGKFEPSGADAGAPKPPRR
jgi:hypothetical protein